VFDKGYVFVSLKHFVSAVVLLSFNIILKYQCVGFFWWVHVAHLFSFLHVFLLLFIYILCLVSNVACVSGLSMFDCLFGFL